MSNIGGSLSWFLSHHHQLWIDSSECIDNYFALYRLNGIYYYCNCSLIQRFETLLVLLVIAGRGCVRMRLEIMVLYDNIMIYRLEFAYLLRVHINS